jgi:hypothetical protein
VNALPEAGDALAISVGKLRGRLGFMYLLGIAVAVQLVQGVVAVHNLAPYTRSYWFITYEEGFTRRGLAGELVRVVTGSIASVTALEALQWLLTLTLIAGLGWLVVETVRRNTPTLDLAAIALCVSPFVFDFVVAQRRPDQLGFIVVVVYGLVVYRFPRSSLTAAAVAGLALAVSVLVADSVFLQCTPWIVVIAVFHAASERRSPVWPVALVAVPSAVAAAASVFVGRLDHAAVDRLQHAASLKYSWIRPGTNDVFAFLGDDLRTSLERVQHLPISTKVGSVAVCVLLFIVQGMLMCGFRVPRVGVAIRGQSFGGTPLVLSVAAAVGALGVLLALGFDWARWFASFGLMGTVAATFGLLSRPFGSDRGDGGDGGGGTPKPRLVPVLLVAGYLLWLAPILDSLDISGGAHYLLMLPP